MSAGPHDLSSHQRQYLKGLAHGLDPIVQLGAAGMTEGVVKAVHAALDDHELIKVKIGKGIESDKKELAGELAERVDAQVCQVIGRVVVLYRQAREPKRRKIKLPARKNN